MVILKGIQMIISIRFLRCSEITGGPLITFYPFVTLKKILNYSTASSIK
jgi:hypothetical protein